MKIKYNSFWKEYTVDYDDGYPCGVFKTLEDALDECRQALTHEVKQSSSQAN